MTQRIYLDNSSTTHPSELSVSKMMPFLTELWGSPSSPHQMGQALFPYIEEGYRAIYKLVGAKDEDTIVFTSSGAEAVNHAVSSIYYDVAIAAGRNHFVTSNIDEAPSIMAMERLEQLGCKIKLAEANSLGIITAQSIADTITPRTALVSLSWANGLTGVVNPVSEISTLCKERGIILHLDATHILGKHFYELEEIGADLISFNGSHFHAPKGTGGLYIHSSRKLSPFIVGGLEQAGNRAGEINVPALIGLGSAAQEAIDSRDYLCTEIARLRNKLETGIMQGFPEATIFFRDQERLPHISAIGFPGIANEALLFALNRRGVLASIGGGNFQQIGLVLIACGVDEKLAQSAISFSLSRESTESEIDRAIKIIVETAQQMRKLSIQMIPKEVGK